MDCFSMGNSDSEPTWLTCLSYLEKRAIKLAREWDQSSIKFHPLLSFVLKAACAGYFCVRVTSEEVFPSAYDVVEEEKWNEDNLTLDRWEESIRSVRFESPPSWLGHTWAPYSHFLLYQVEDYFLLPRFMGILNSFIFSLTRLNEASNVLEWKQVGTPIQLNYEQQFCFESVQKHHVYFLLGGPGTGKSFTAVTIIEHAIKSGFRVAVLAPTGKAVSSLKKRLHTAERCFCGTIHRVLGLSTHAPFHSRLNPIPYDFVLLDECSMIDAHLFSYLLEAIPTGARLLLMGDVNQLPSVEMGGAFSLLVEWGKKHDLLTQLETFIRMETEGLSALTKNVLLGDVESCFEILKKDSSLHWIEESVRSTWPQEIVKLFGDWFKMWLTVNEREAFILIDKFKILVPLRVGDMGSDGANLFITSWVIFLARKQGIESFYIPVMVIKNLTSEGLCNGDQGIVRIDTSTLDPLSQNRVIIFCREDDEILFKHELSSRDLKYGWCLSIHKSQGSEFDHVVVVLPKVSSKLLSQQLLYTALTRAKKKMTVWANKSEVELAISKVILRSEDGLMRLLT
ncbi:ATP-dependent DNA helicase [Candidatus Similichlamydia epinepheli]|uniref:ATP-dependent DNA helicase n=1 Tax=Candidatus Similichlamydia epinepheli TaxID=1903953 RepID=UPI000D3BD9DC|nr:AAA family ATPase [Candidatus Similichlamydia epinepheli]